MGIIMGGFLRCGRPPASDVLHHVPRGKGK